MHEPRQANACHHETGRDLPGVLDEIAEVAGRDAAVAVSICYGGEWLHVPKPEYLAANPGHRLVEAAGPDGAAAIARRMAGCSEYIPYARRACACHLAERGLDARAIALRLRTSPKTIRRYLLDAARAA